MKLPQKTLLVSNENLYSIEELVAALNADD